MIEVEKLSRRFGTLTAVDELSFEVKSGTVLGFLGPNGAGKSTTMKMITGFLAPSSGTARIGGHDIVSDSVRARRIMGYVPEGAPLYGELTCRQLLLFVAGARGLTGSAAQKAVEQAMERLDLKPVMHQSIETLSKGFRRRVGLAQAILHDPAVLVLDEPTDGLDPNQKYQVRQLIRSMATDKTIIISTHILEEVEAVCSRAMIIARGRLLADDTPAGLISRSRYHNAVTLETSDTDQVASGLSELPEAREVEVRGRRVTVFPSGRGRLFDATARLIQERNWTVRDVRLEGGRLDQVFREITEQEVHA